MVQLKLLKSLTTSLELVIMLVRGFRSLILGMHTIIARKFVTAPALALKHIILLCVRVALPVQSICSNRCFNRILVLS